MHVVAASLHGYSVRSKVAASMNRHQGSAMATDVRKLNLKLVRQGDSVELDMLPLQGLWTQEQYLRLSNQTNNLLEFVDGEIEVLSIPTRRHQVILLLLYELLKGFLQPLGGKVLVAP
jgi:hypothetical protein